MMSHVPVRIRKPLEKAITRPMPSTVPATANGEVATMSISADRRERWRVMT